MRMRPHDAVIGDYLKLYLQSPGYWRQISNVTDGIAIPNINGSKLGAVRLPIPPREEQRRIVEILEDHLSRLDAADGLLTLQTSRIASLRLASLTKLATEQSAAGVAAVPLGDLGRSDLGKMLDAKRATGEPTPYLRNINVRWGEFDLSDVRSVPLTDTERSRLELCPGDLLVCEGGEPGRCAVWPGSASIMTFQKALHRVRFPRDTANPHYVALMLGQVIRSGRASRLFTGTTIKHLPQEKLRLISIPVPALGVQDDIVRQTESLEDSFGALHASIRAAHTRSSSLRRALLAAAFSGRLTGRDSDLDRAEELVS